MRPPGQWNRVTLIGVGNRFAVYLSGQPTAYFEDATFPDEGALMPTFSGDPSLPAEGEFDNVRFWRLAPR